VVRGYKKATVDLPSLTYVDNDDFATTQEVVSLSKAADSLEGATVVSYGDVLFKKYILQQLVDSDADFAVAVDADWRESRNKNRLADYAVCSQPNSKKTLLGKVTLKDMVSDPESPGIEGEWMGFLKVSANGAKILKTHLASLDAEAMRRMRMTDVLKALVKAGHEVRAIYTTGHWLDVDSVSDVVQGGSF
jgi:phosphoenolpyruvate phosphomutase